MDHTPSAQPGDESGPHQQKARPEVPPEIKQPTRPQQQGPVEAVGQRPVEGKHHGKEHQIVRGVEVHPPPPFHIRGRPCSQRTPPEAEGVADLGLAPVQAPPAPPPRYTPPPAAPTVDGPGGVRRTGRQTPLLLRRSIAPSSHPSKSSPADIGHRFQTVHFFRWAMVACSSGRSFSTVHRKIRRAQMA